MKQKTPDEQIKEFVGRKSDTVMTQLGHRYNTPMTHWYQIPAYLILILDLTCLFLLPPLILLCLARYMGWI